MVNGVQHVIMDGVIAILMWCADNWDLEHMDIAIEIILVKDQGQYGLIMFTVQTLNQH